MTKPPTSDAAGAVLPESPAMHRMNGLLCDFSMRWKLDGDYLRCRTCDRPQIASCADRDFPHANICVASPNVETNPWRTLLAILTPLSTPQPPPEAGSVEERKQWGHALERCTESQRRLAKEIDDANPGDPWASLSVWEDVLLLETMHAALLPAPAPKESP